MKHVLMIIIAILGCAVANAQYKVGDIYNNDGIKGIVVKVDNSGQHGLIMSLTNSVVSGITTKRLNSLLMHFTKTMEKRIWLS